VASGWLLPTRPFLSSVWGERAEQPGLAVANRGGPAAESERLMPEAGYEARPLRALVTLWSRYHPLSGAGCPFVQDMFKAELKIESTIFRVVASGLWWRKRSAATLTQPSYGYGPLRSACSPELRNAGYKTGALTTF